MFQIFWVTFLLQGVDSCHPATHSKKRSLVVFVYVFSLINNLGAVGFSCLRLDSYVVFGKRSRGILALPVFLFQFNRTSNDIHVFNLNEWPDHSVPESVMSLVQLIDEAERTQRSLGGGPIIVHCRYLIFNAELQKVSGLKN